LDVESGLDVEPLALVCRSERLRHLRLQRVSTAGVVERNARVLVLERREHGPLLLEAFPSGPTNAARHELLEPRVRPRARIVTPRGVEDAAFSVTARPRPRLALLARLVLRANLQYVLVRVVPRVHVRLVPALERQEPARDRMVEIDD